MPKEGAALVCCERAIDSENDKACSTGSNIRPVRIEAVKPVAFFSSNDFSFVDGIVDPCREHRDGPKGYPPNAIFMALLLMYFTGMESVLDLIRFLGVNSEWLKTLGLCRKVRGRLQYSVPHRSTFYKFADRMGSVLLIQEYKMEVGFESPN